MRNDTQAASDFVSHQAFIDQAAASIVYQVVDNRTQAVVAQYPDEAVLRRRAYFHTLDLTKGEPTRHSRHRPQGVTPRPSVSSRASQVLTTSEPGLCCVFQGSELKSDRHCRAQARDHQLRVATAVSR